MHKQIFVEVSKQVNEIYYIVNRIQGALVQKFSIQAFLQKFQINNKFLTVLACIPDGNF